MIAFLVIQRRLGPPSGHCPSNYRCALREWPQFILPCSGCYSAAQCGFALRALATRYRHFRVGFIAVTCGFPFSLLASRCLERLLRVTKPHWRLSGQCFPSVAIAQQPPSAAENGQSKACLGSQPSFIKPAGRAMRRNSIARLHQCEHLRQVSQRRILHG